jgi:hypothetical protein
MEEKARFELYKTYIPFYKWQLWTQLKLTAQRYNFVGVTRQKKLRNRQQAESRQLTYIFQVKCSQICLFFVLNTRMIPIMLISSTGKSIIAFRILYSPIITDPKSRIIAVMFATKMTYRAHDFL